MKIVALIPAFNEAESIAATIESLLNQNHPVHVVVVANGCTDDTVKIARRYDVKVMDLPRLPHRKSQAMNMAWTFHCQDADFVITVDADTTLEPDTVERWMDEFALDPNLGGSCARFTMQGQTFLARLQKYDFALGIDSSLHRGWTAVLAGAGSCFRNEILKEIAELEDRDGPWTYESAVEDFEITYQLRKMGWSARVSPTVRAYTDHMRSLGALTNQRLKWNAGTITDLLRFGLNQYTIRLWGQQLLGIASAAIIIMFIILMTVTAVYGGLEWSWYTLAIPAIMWMRGIKSAFRTPEHDWKDVAIGCSFLIYEVFGWLRVFWFIRAWVEVLLEKLRGTSKDRWEKQYSAESKGGVVN